MRADRVPACAQRAAAAAGSLAATTPMLPAPSWHVPPTGVGTGVATLACRPAFGPDAKRHITVGPAPEGVGVGAGGEVGPGDGGGVGAGTAPGVGPVPFTDAAGGGPAAANAAPALIAQARAKVVATRGQSWRGMRNKRRNTSSAPSRSCRCERAIRCKASRIE